MSANQIQSMISCELYLPIRSHASLTREPVGHGLEVDAGGGHPLGVRHEAVGEVTPVREVLTHDAVMRGEQTWSIIIILVIIMVITSVLSRIIRNSSNY